MKHILVFAFCWISCMLVSESHSGSKISVMPKDIRSQYSKIVSDPRTPYFSSPREASLIVKSDCSGESDGRSERIAFG